MSILTILTIIFSVLKLNNLIDWSWWLVLSPSILYVILFFIVSFIETEKILKVSHRRNEMDYFKNRMNNVRFIKQAKIRNKYINRKSRR